MFGIQSQVFCAVDGVDNQLVEYLPSSWSGVALWFGVTAFLFCVHSMVRYMCVSACMCECVYVCMCECVYVCVCSQVCMYVCVGVWWMYVCVWVIADYLTFR